MAHRKRFGIFDLGFLNLNRIENRELGEGNGFPKDLKRDRKEEQKMNAAMRMNDGMRDFLKYLVVALCSAIVAYFTASCTAGLVIGHNQRQHQENNISTRVDSAHVAPTITIR